MFPFFNSPTKKSGKTVKTAGPKGWKPARGIMMKKGRCLQVFKPQAGNPQICKIKGGMGARIIRLNGRKVHVTKAKEMGWVRHNKHKCPPKPAKKSATK